MYSDRSSAQPEATLTPRQEQIRSLLRQGFSNKMIAGNLGISEGTVKNHITEIFRVLNATNRTQAARFSFEAAQVQSGISSRTGRTIMFDAEEYLHLALHASFVGQHHACMEYLKEALQQQPGNAKAIYLLAAQHAELGLFERAISGMKAALSIEPELEIARFQLGLLLLDRNYPAQAREHFSELSSSSDEALRVYSEAMIALGDNDSMAAREKLVLGLSRESRNPALSALMQRLLDRLSKSDEATVGKSDEQNDQISLGAYRQTSS